MNQAFPTTTSSKAVPAGWPMTAVLLLSYFVIGSRAGLADDMVLAKSRTSPAEAKCVGATGKRSRNQGRIFVRGESILKGESGPGPPVPGQT